MASVMGTLTPAPMCAGKRTSPVAGLVLLIMSLSMLCAGAIKLQSAQDSPPPGDDDTPPLPFPFPLPPETGERARQIIDGLRWSVEESGGIEVIEGVDELGVAVRYSSALYDPLDLPLEAQQQLQFLLGENWATTEIYENGLFVDGNTIGGNGVGRAMWEVMELADIEANPDVLHLLSDCSEGFWTSAVWTEVREYLAINGWEVVELWFGYSSGGSPMWLWYATPIP